MPDTIFALSSGSGPAGVAVMRISGPAAKSALEQLAGLCPRPRQASLRTLAGPGGEMLDRALVVWFPGPRSFTGEDVVELHVHGGPAVVGGIVTALGRMAGLRPAERGEFTRRAFENGKLDLTEAEALSDLIEAETDAQRSQALRLMSNGLGATAETWRAELVRAMALVEAAIDFSDEADVVTDALAQARQVVDRLTVAMADVLADGRRGEILRDGYKVVIAGPPNAGKSSLINALSRREVAIVTDEAGTTRDVLEVRLDLGGIPVLFMDTAGLRETSGKVEREGIRRTLLRAREAHLVLWVVDAMAPVPEPAAELGARRVLRVVNKADAGAFRLAGVPAISCATGAGITELVDAIGAAVGGAPSDAALITRVRHRMLIEECVAACRDFLSGSLDAAELRAEDLRRAAHALGRLTGRVDVEDVLDDVFGRFCIGK